MAKSVYQILIELEGDKNVKSALQDLGKTVGLTGAALTAFSVGAGKLAADYEQALANLRTVSDETTGSTEEFSGALFDLQNELNGAVNVQEAALAAYDLASAGIKDQTALTTALGQSQKAAIAGQSDLASISKAATSIVNSYGDALGEGLTQAQRFDKAINLLIQTQLDGVITGGEYAASIGNIASLAKSAGIPLETLNAAIATSTAKGTPAAQAFTRLQAVIANLAVPTKAATDEAKELGIEFSTTALKAQGLDGLLASIFNAENFDDNTIANLFGSVEAQGIVQQLGGDLELLNKNIENQANGLGALDLAYNELDETVNQRVTNSLNLLQGALIKIGTGALVAFEPVLKIIVDLVAAFSTLPTPVLATVGAVAGLSGVALTAAGAVLLLATSIGAVQGNLAIGLPILINAVKGISALAASALTGSISLKSFNLSLLTSNAQLGLMAVNSKKAIVALGPLLLTGALFGGAAASIGLVVDTLNKLDVAADQNRTSLQTLEEKLLAIKKAGEGTTPEIAKEEGKQALEKLNGEIGFLQRQLDKLRGQDGLGTALEGAANRGSIAFGDLAESVGEVENTANQLLGGGIDVEGLLSPEEATAKMRAYVDSLDPAKIGEVTQQIDASIESLESSVVTSETDILARDAQIERLGRLKNTLNGVTEETKENTGATEEQGQTAEEAADQYEAYAKRVNDSVKNIDAQTANSVNSLVGSESFKVQETLRIQEQGVNRQVALLEDLRDQEQTSAEEKVKIETEIQTKKVELNKNRIEANKQLEELYNQFLRDSNELNNVAFERTALEQNLTVEQTYNDRKQLLQETFDTELEILEAKLVKTKEGSAEEKAIILEINQLRLGFTLDQRTLDEQVTQERLAQIERLKEAELDRLNLLTQAQDIQAMMLDNSNAVLESQAGILGKIGGLLEGDNATLEQRAELVGLVEQITGQTLSTAEGANLVGQAKFVIEQELANIEIKKLDLKIKQLEIDKEQLRIANEIKQLEIGSERSAIAEQLSGGGLTNQERQALQRRDSALAQQSNLENQKTNLSNQAIDSQLEFAGFERQLADILARGIRSVGNGATIENQTVSQLKERALANTGATSSGGNIGSQELESALANGLITREEYNDIFKELETKLSKELEAQRKEAERGTEATKETSNNTANLGASQDQTNTQLAGNTEEIRNVSGSIGSLLNVAQSQLQVQTRMSARLDQISKQLDTLPGNIAARLPRAPQPTPVRR